MTRLCGFFKLLFIKNEKKLKSIVVDANSIVDKLRNNHTLKLKLAYERYRIHILGFRLQLGFFER